MPPPCIDGTLAFSHTLAAGIRMEEQHRVTATALATSITHTNFEQPVDQTATAHYNHRASCTFILDTPQFTSLTPSCPLLYCHPVPYRACRCAPSQQLWCCC